MQEGRIAAGAYDYHLVKEDSDWYLSSVERGEETAIRPEAGAYAANSAAAANLFDTRHSDRQGTVYRDPLTGEKRDTRLWLHATGARTTADDDSGQLRVSNNHYSALLGGSLAEGVSGAGRWRIGAEAGYGHSRSNTVSRLTGYRARGEVDGYTLGAYGTWYAEGTANKGLWLESELRYNWFDNSVTGTDELGEEYHAKGMTASLEGGYVIAISQSLRRSVFVQPQAQISWSGITADDHTEQNGTRVSAGGNDNIRSRMGLRAYMQVHAARDDDNGRYFEPYIEANYIHNSQSYGATLDGVAVDLAGSRDIVEMKAGLKAVVSRNLSLGGGISQQWGQNRWSESAATLTVKYAF
ncbi:autotransporter outer membrane beta-barrel domain-containing protein [Martelella alba]|uniref:Autotransporter outer membrane beta-barrel domain-containing protein n=1 Tax=Martelella alba TaxID=2590451 RepID=A0ABY2SFG8_9HYPH|nr:autotransporter outer membrane beta-barrel domain-containing protein [Martelella alba]